MYLVHVLGIHALAMRSKIKHMYLVRALGNVRTEQKLERLIACGDMYEEIRDGRSYVGVTRHKSSNRYSCLHTV